MFERYTETSRRVIFFARHEVTLLGGGEIDTGHLLLGLLRDSRELALRLLQSTDALDGLRRVLEARLAAPDRMPPEADLPLTANSRRVLERAAEEADCLGHTSIGPEHLLLGMLHEENTLCASLFEELGVQLDEVRRIFASPA